MQYKTNLLGPVVPIYLTLTISAFIGIVDVCLAGRIGENVQAGVGLADQFLFFAALLGMGLSSGVASCVARAIGARQYDLARQYIKEGILLSAFLGMLSALIATTVAPLILPLFSSSAISLPASHYLLLCAPGNLPYSIVICQTAALRAIGSARLGVFQWLIITATSTLPPLIAGHFFPDTKACTLEIIAVSWDVGAFVGAAAGAYFLKAGLSSFEADFGPSDLLFTNARRRMRELVMIGLPVAATEACWILSNFLIYGLLGSMDSAANAQAAWTIRLKVDEIACTTPLLALSLTAQTICGHKIGAKDLDGARKATQSIVLCSLLLMTVVASAIALLADPIARSLSTSTTTITLTKPLLYASLSILPMMSVYMTIFGALEGAGYTRMPMLAIIGGLFGIRFPLAWLLSGTLGQGMTGIITAVCLSHAAVLVAAIALYKQRSWEHWHAEHVPAS
ncbi:MAG TPA: MATE family efflux transporter [Candidatus Obscuribacterales bacterium]